MNASLTDLTNCDREPIHQPGAVQPHGVLLVCRPTDLTITHVSQNVEKMLGFPADSLVGQPIRTIFPPDAVEVHERILRQEIVDTKPVYVFTVPVRGVSQPFDAIAHRHGDSIFLELEPAEVARSLSAPDLYRLVQSSISRLQQATSLDEIFQICAEQVKKISGFDRVMVYRFDEEWNGQVVAETRRDDLEPFLGLHYPASDIPKQARELYTKNWLRFIADRDYQPAAVWPPVGPESAAPLDMSFCVLRSVSPIHLEYLRNMGVGASMSISLLRAGKLWGLVACHHYSSRFVPYKVRTACEMLGHFMSLSLGSAEERGLADERASREHVRQQLLAQVERDEDTAKALIESQPNLLDFLQAEGAAVIVGDEVSRIGQTPGEDEIRDLSRWLFENTSGDVFTTDNLRSHYGTGILGSVSAGVLVVAIPAARPHQMIWFRTEKIRIVDWAGDPAKSVVKSEGEVRLSPRGSFALWKDTVRGRSQPWTRPEIEAAQLLHDGVARQLLRRSEQLAAANSDLRLASVEREKAIESERAARSESERLNRMKDEFVATLSHELRTPLNAILGWAQVLSSLEQPREEFAEGLQVIERNARAQAQMIEDLLDISRIVSGKVRLDLQEANLARIVEDAVQTVELTAGAKGVRIEKLIDPLLGVQVTGDPGRLQQVVWNLLTNAVKFTPRGGRVQVVLERVDSHVELTVTDTGQGIPAEFLPHVFDRFRQGDGSITRKSGGLGLGLSIVRNLVELHGGTIRAHSPGVDQGATFVVSLPVRAVQRPEGKQRVHPRSRSASADRESLQLAGVRVLTIDDEPDARQLIARILTECKCVVKTVATIDEAMQVLADETFDVVVSDIGMPEGDGYEFIRRLRDFETQHGRAKTPAIALTAFARVEDRRRVILAGFHAHIAKPVESGELLALVASAAGRV